jgi:hypothetical protein
MNRRHHQLQCKQGLFRILINIEYKRDRVSRFFLLLNSMKMGYFRRVKFLKRANTLDLTPVRKLDSRMEDNGNITLLVPKFKNRALQRFLLSDRRSPIIRIRLDNPGTKLWQAIDGTRTVGSIIARLKDDREERPAEIEERVSKFIFKLYQERYISFKEIE